MTGKLVRSCLALLLAGLLLAPAAVMAQPVCDCPGSSYAPCHYNFPLLWNVCAHLSFHWHRATEPPPPFSLSYYDYRSHCPYANPSALLGFASIVQRSKTAPEGVPAK
jgi:hypothetical protein